ncbi:MAG: type III pantothenate kinase [Proteobacteria bacterium]|nr:type III pantothenate kinase [Pseudomonadota bacterium]MCP4920671.1 type III pantothenate kinase [Pseudomonadota bacterium]
MLLVIDVGNTNTVIGLMRGVEVHERFRITTKQRTTDEFGLVLRELLKLHGHSPADVTGCIVSCVVPSTLFNIDKACRQYMDVEPLVVGRGLKTGMRVRVDNPREVGSDRIVNAVAALEKWSPALVLVDFGTATTFDCVDKRGDYVGGAIAPGMRISAEALFNKTSKLPRVEVKRPKNVIGTNTVAAMQSGLFFGYVGLVDHLARRCKEALGGDVRCVATGGFSNLIGRACDEIDHVDEHLTLRGLSLLHSRNISTR